MGITLKQDLVAQNSIFYQLPTAQPVYITGMSSSNKPLTNKLVVSLMFTKNSGGGEYVCLTCSKPCKSPHGYTNLITHLRINHPTYLEDAGRAAKYRNFVYVS
ncbi:hypothetical protein F444_18944 [Phytophthora nicotianae P1976]|uniref:BED-type domain-containing protein n=1 Tax=Phytophthora nicotianae P1976 TaxID=1317066 RepID=A0A080Z9J2_PHYNI|nr:hypothetical protein F444_18944 [Phytophthora nicotianae P1976]